VRLRYAGTEPSGPLPGMGGTGSSSAWTWVASGQAAREQQLSRVRKQEQEVSSMAVEDGTV
jgi:hypothetical protein